jgi:hypothetical protein
VSKLRRPPAGLIVTPGASADRDHPTLVAIEAGLPEIAVERLTLATTSVPSAVTKIGAAADELAARLGVAPNEIALGGRSFGGRSCSVAVAEGLPAAALVLLSYPLHPPGKPENLRVDHFPQIAVPSLFVSGDHDPFGTPAELVRHLGAIRGHVDVELVPGAHSPKGQDATIVALIRRFFGM